ncbi:hypothetical protein D0Z08_26055 [Nocardioides immobilis]|uniref:WD40 repeat domain-containing protein n=1 Tax=Nocardioides immobilis TaxID=2049295 RepID=A0A417XV57_9ACTN|nr:hypothetical protein [Nocardioides immobilis]RHW24185.1 hypothetical protein D0Z08_26055 [Nocardioides immobilis]
MHGRVAVLAGLVAVLVVGMIVVLTWGGDDAEDPEETARPAFAVLKPKDAALAVEGDDGDFEVVHEITPSEGEGAEAILPDGRLVVVRSEQEDLETYHYLDLVDPSSGEREEVPAPWRDAAPGTYPAVTVLDDDRLMVAWSDSERGDSEDWVMVLDLDTGEHEEFTRPAVSLDRGVKVLSYPEPGGDGRYYFQTGRQLCGDGECFTPRRGVLWSFVPGDDDARREMEGVVEFAVAGDLLAWVPESPNSTIKVRDLVTGDERGYTLRGSCTIGGLIASATLVVLACPNSQRHVVIDAEARPVVDLRLSYEYPSVGDRWIMVSPFAYDTQTGRLLRLFDRTGADSTRELGGDLAVVRLGPADSGYSGNADRSDRWAIVRLSDRRTWSATSSDRLRRTPAGTAAGPSSSRSAATRGGR